MHRIVPLPNLLFGILLAGCAHTTAHTPANGSSSPAAAAVASASEPSREDVARRLTAHAEQLDRSVQTARHTQLIAVLSAMADSISLLSPSDRERLVALRNHLHSFEQAEPESPAEMQHLVSAIESILAALDASSGAADQPEIAAALHRAQASLARVSPRTGLLAQADAARGLVHATTEAVLAALGAETDPGSAERTTGPEDSSFGEPRDLSWTIEAALQRVASMSGAGWLAHRRLTAETLDLLSTALTQLTGGADVTAQVDELRFQARRLKRSGTSGFTPGEWPKRGLLAALFGVERGVSRALRAELEPWIETARAAAANLDDWGALGFQRARTQDAFRCVVDVFRLAADKLEAEQSRGSTPAPILE